MILIAAVMTLAACSGMQDIAGGVGDIAGIETPKTEEVELSVGAVCPNCSAESHATINPFTEPVKYTKVGDAEVDSFVESANNTYGSVLVLEKLVELGMQGEDAKIDGFKDKDEVMSLGKGIMESATSDIPTLIASGTTLATAVPGKFSDPSKALVAPTAVEQVQNAIDRLNIAQEKLTGIAGKMGGEETPEAPAE
jgi:hypothetical protein